MLTLIVPENRVGGWGWALLTEMDSLVGIKEAEVSPVESPRLTTWYPTNTDCLMLLCSAFSPHMECNKPDQEVCCFFCHTEHWKLENPQFGHKLRWYLHSWRSFLCTSKKACNFYVCFFFLVSLILSLEFWNCSKDVCDDSFL